MRNNKLEEKVLKYLKRAQKDGRTFETRKVEFKETYKLKKAGKIIKAVRAELIRDVISLANSLPDPEEETGFLILGVKANGQLVRNYHTPVGDISELNSLINSVLERHIFFSYREFNDPDSGRKFGAIIIPDSASKPHIVSTNFHDDNGKLLLKIGECWTRREGCKTISLAVDYDKIYEYKSYVYAAGTMKAKEEMEKRLKEKKRKKKSRVEEIYKMTPEQIDKLSRRIFK